MDRAPTQRPRRLPPVALDLVEVPLRRPGRARDVAGAFGALLVAVAVAAVWSTPTLVVGVVAGLVGVTGALLLRVAYLPSGWMRVSADRLVIRAGALRRPIVVAREEIRLIAVGAHTGGATSAGAARRQLRRAEGGAHIRWGPRDLAQLVPPVDAHVRLVPPDANLAIVLRPPAPAPVVRWASYLLGLVFPPLTEPTWRPGRERRVLLLRVDDAESARAALAGWPVQPDLTPLAVADHMAPSSPLGLRTAIAVGLAFALLGGIVGDLATLRPAAAVGACDTARGLVGQALDRQPATALPTPPEIIVPSELDLPGGSADLVAEQHLSAAMLAKSHPAGHGVLQGLERWGLLTAYERRWVSPSGGDVSIAVQSFASHDGAHDYHVYSALHACERALETFDVPGLERATAMRLPGTHTIVDEVAFVAGAHRFVVTTASTEPPETLQHALAEIRATALAAD